MTQMIRGQERFMREGGIYAPALDMLRDKGILAPEGSYVFQEYPKALRFGTGQFDRRSREICLAPIVASKAEEKEITGLVAQAEALGVDIDPDWTADLIRTYVTRAVEAAAARDQVIDPRAAAAQKAERLRRELAELEAIAGGDGEGAPATTAKSRSRRDLPVVAPDPVG